MMPYRILCNGVQREGAKLSPALASELFCYVPITQNSVWRLVTLAEKLENTSPAFRVQVWQDR